MMIVNFCGALAGGLGALRGAAASISGSQKAILQRRIFRLESGFIPFALGCRGRLFSRRFRPFAASYRVQVRAA
jgi:hypothetical protein